MKLYTFGPKLRITVARLLNDTHRDNLTDWEVKFLTSASAQCLVTGKISHKQLSTIGRIYKRLVQRGKYVHHNWSIWN